MLEAAQSEEFMALIVDLPTEVIYALSLGVAVRLVAAGTRLKDEQLDTLVTATWRAVTHPLTDDPPECGRPPQVLAPVPTYAGLGHRGALP